MSAQEKALESVYRHFPCIGQIPYESLRKAYKSVNKVLWEQYGSGQISRKYLERHRFLDTFDKLGIDCDRVDEVAGFYITDYRNYWEWIPGANEALDHISRKYPVGFITNGFSETQWLKVEDFQLQKYSKTIIVSEDVGVMKPMPGIFEHAAALAGRDGREILYVGDSYTSDVVGGKSAGWQIAWFRPENGVGKTVEADFTFVDFSELTSYLLD